jgi:glycine cleavage system H protein
VESVKAASDVYAPVAGEVVARNDALAQAPNEVNKDPYAAWLFRIKPVAGASLDNLMDASTYRKGFTQA